MQEKNEFNIPTAFVDRTALYKALRSKGVPGILLQIITALHENTDARVRVGPKLSPRISTASGVRQGWMFAPILFCVATDWVIQHMTFNPGIAVHPSTFTDLVYADDTALLLPSAMDAAATASFKSSGESSSYLGLHTSWPKTKRQNISSGLKPPVIAMDSNIVESVDSFVYLGSLQSLHK